VIEGLYNLSIFLIFFNSFIVQNPDFNPDINAAPIAVLSMFAGLSISKLEIELWNCIKYSDLEAPPSTLILLSGLPKSFVIALNKSFD